MRLCTVKGRKAIFHKWIDVAEVVAPSQMIGGHPGGQLCDTFAIVEFEDGKVSAAYPSDIVFKNTDEFISKLEEEE